MTGRKHHISNAHYVQDWYHWEGVKQGVISSKPPPKEVPQIALWVYRDPVERYGFLMWPSLGLHFLFELCLYRYLSAFRSKCMCCEPTSAGKKLPCMADKKDVHICQGLVRLSNKVTGMGLGHSENVPCLFLSEFISNLEKVSKIPHAVSYFFPSKDTFISTGPLSCR